MTEQTMTSKQLSIGKQIPSGKALMTAERRAEIDAVLESRIRELLAARGEDFAGQFPQVANGYPLTGRLWLFGTAYRVFMDRRSQNMQQELKTECPGDLLGNPQTRSGRALIRGRNLLFRLICRHAVENGLLCAGPL